VIALAASKTSSSKHSLASKSAKLNNKEIKAIIQQVQDDTKSVMSKRPHDAISKSDMVKIERDANRMQTLVQFERKGHSKLLTYHEEQKLQLLNN
jgi:hypothetical protein